MPILPLPDKTTRLLGSTLVFNDATSVVKELIDNALDSGATSIAIEISANALDIIQVKDNGSGIGVEDIQLLCKRGCTSKIRNLEDLDNLGGQSLGFRGEALASIAELSESVSIVTRVDGESVGTNVRFGPGGEMLSSVSASHPVGTTLRVQNFLLQVPVRKQAALKNASRVLGDIKRLLFQYAFARPTIRLAFKVLKGKNDKANWMYAPCDSSEHLLSAAAKIGGKEVTYLCKQVSGDTLPGEADGYRASALLLEPDADGAKLNHLGQYIAIDKRPLSTDRGSMKEVAKLYKRYLYNSRGPDSKQLSKPFIVLHLYCPRGSYDVNIEPSKDDVLFHDVDKVLECLRKIFGQIYGDLEDTESERSKHKRISIVESVAPSFDLLLARKDPSPDSNSPAAIHEKSWQTLPSGTTIARQEQNFDQEPCSDADIAESNATTHQTLTPFRNVYDVDEEDDSPIRQEPMNSDSAMGIDGDDSGGSNFWLKNPFTTAALHARISPKQLGSISPSDAHEILFGNTNVSGREVSRSSSPIRPKLTSPGHNLTRETHFLPTPSKSPTHNCPYQNPGPPIPRRSRRDDNESGFSPDAEISSSNHSLQSQQDFFRRWTQEGNARIPMSMSAVKVAKGGDVGEHGVSERESLLREVRPVSKIHSLQHQPVTSSLKRHDKFSSSVVSGQDSITDIKSGPLTSELQSIMDFEHRKKAINQRPVFSRPGLNPAELMQIQRQSLTGPEPVFEDESYIGRSTIPNSSTAADIIVPTRASLGLPPRSTQSPHRNRYTAALKSLKEPSRTEALASEKAEAGLEGSAVQANLAINGSAGSNATDTRMAHSDPRAYLITLQTKANSASGSQLQRVKSSRLPFESITKAEVKHNVVCFPSTACPGSEKLQDLVKRLSETDEYITSGQLSHLKWNPFSKQVETWKSSLERILEAQYDTQNNVSNGDAHSNRKDRDSNGSQNIFPEISLVRAIKCHLQMLAEQGDMS